MRHSTPLLTRAAFVAALIAAAGCGTREAPREAPGSAAGGRERVSVTEAVPDTGADPMIVALESAFTARNPASRQVSILEFRREGAGGGANLVLARGAPPGAAYRGPAGDELFGIFVFDDSLKRVQRTVAMFPTPRRDETAMRFDRTTPESVFVLGWARTSGETLLIAGFPWGAAR